MAATFTFQDDKNENNTTLICEIVKVNEYQKFLIDQELNDNPASKKLFVHTIYAGAIDREIIHFRSLERNTQVSDIDRDSGIT